METEDVLKLREAREELVRVGSNIRTGTNLGNEPKVNHFQVKELDFELVAPSLLQHKVISAADYGVLSRLPGEEQVGFHHFQEL